jgi:molybdopterin synthase sulfur carrier subunit
MITFNVTGFLTDFTGGQSQIVVDAAAKTVGEALGSLWQQHPGLRDRVVNEQGQLRQHVNIFLNEDNVRRQRLLDTTLPDNCEITILPAVSGGANKRESVKGERVRGKG